LRKPIELVLKAGERNPIRPVKRLLGDSRRKVDWKDKAVGQREGVKRKRKRGKQNSQKIGQTTTATNTKNGRTHPPPMQLIVETERN